MDVNTIAALAAAAPVLIGGVLWLNRISSTSTRIADAVLGFTDKRTGDINVGLGRQVADIGKHQEHIYERLRGVEAQLDPMHKGALVERLTSVEGNSQAVLATVQQIREENTGQREAMSMAVSKALHDATNARSAARGAAAIVATQFNGYTRQVKAVLGNPDLPVDPIDVIVLLDAEEK